MRHSTRQSRLLRSGTIAGVAAGLLILAGCAAEPPQVPPPVTVTPTVDVTRSTPPAPAVPIVWPLTGVETDSLPDRPAVAVKIENSRLARPQTGLNDADMVWETIVDFDVSRLVAVYHSKTPSGIGPIRSVRPMDMAIVAPLHSPLVYSGGQSGILALVPKAGIQGMNNDYGAAGMYRVSFRSGSAQRVRRRAGVHQERRRQAQPGAASAVRLRPDGRAGHGGDLRQGDRQDLDATVDPCPPGLDLERHGWLAALGGHEGGPHRQDQADPRP